MAVLTKTPVQVCLCVWVLICVHMSVQVCVHVCVCLCQSVGSVYESVSVRVCEHVHWQWGKRVPVNERGQRARATSYGIQLEVPAITLL